MEEEKKGPGLDEMYCWSCGAVIKKQAEICLHCGVRVRRDNMAGPEGAHTVLPVIGGILGIVAGALGIIFGIFYISISIILADPTDDVYLVLPGIGMVISVLGAIAVVCSRYAIARKKFRLAILGAACSIFPVWMLGIPALVLIAISSKEFYAPTGEA